MANVLFVASNATAIQFDFATELERLQAARERASGSFTLTARWSVSADDLHRLLQEQEPDVLHLLSPGVNPTNHGLMLDRSGKVEYVAPGAFTKIFDLPETKSPALVVLNTCHSLKHGEAIAPSVGAVIAMKGLIYDVAAVEFATVFYDALAFGSSVRRLLTRAGKRLRGWHRIKSTCPFCLPDPPIHPTSHSRRQRPNHCLPRQLS